MPQIASIIEVGRLLERRLRCLQRLDLLVPTLGGAARTALERDLDVTAGCAIAARVAATGLVRDRDDVLGRDAVADQVVGDLVGAALRQGGAVRRARIALDGDRRPAGVVSPGRGERHELLAV